MNKLLTIIGTVALLVSANAGHAQAPTFEWVQPFTPSSSQMVSTTQTNSIVNDTLGNVYSSGFFSGTVDFDPGPGVNTMTSTGQRSSFVVKLDSSGSFIWAVMVGDTGTVESGSLAISPAGHLFMSGAFSADNDFDPGPGVSMLTKSGTRNVFVLKLDLNGNFVWAKSFGGTLNYVQSAWCAADVYDNVIVTSAFNGTMDADPGPGVQNLVNTLTGNQDIFIIKLDPAGNLAWGKQIGSANGEFSLSIITDLSGDVYTAGYFTNTLDFDPGVGTYNMTSSGTSRDVFVVKLDVNGGFQWARSVGAQGMELCTSLVTDMNNNIILSGSFANTVDFDPGSGVYNLTSTGGPSAPDIFVLKLTKNGVFTWARNWAHYGCGYGFIITSDRSDAIYMTGNFKNTMDLDPGVGTYNVVATSSGPTDLFTLKLNSAGIFDWGLSTGGTAHVYGYSISVSKYYDVFTNGIFTGTIDFDPGTGVNNVPAVNGYNMYMHKLNQNITIGMPEQETANTFTVYPNPGTGIFNLTGDDVAETITVTDIHGREVLSLQPQAANVSLDMRAFAAGVYTVRVQRGDGVSAARLVLQR